MDKRFQFFISSTFADLSDERQAVLKAVLELNHIPAGMELFPASDDTVWQLIRDVIDASDYYLLVVGGRYGSVDEAGLGYTEKEYDYAIQTEKPVIAFLHADPGMLPRDKTETDDAAWKKLEAFRAKVEKRHTRVSWTSAEELKSKVIVSITSALKRHPAVGWLRADQVPSGGTLADVLTLRNRVVELETQLKEVALVAPAGTEDLEHGDDPVRIDVQFDTVNSFTYVSETLKNHITLTWNDIFGSPKVRVGHFASLTLGGGSSMSVPQRHDYPDERGRRVTPKSENSAPSVQAGKSRMCTVSHLSIVI